MNLDPQPLPEDQLGKYLCHCGQRAIKFVLVIKPGQRPAKRYRCGNCTRGPAMS